MDRPARGDNRPMSECRADLSHDRNAVRGVQYDDTDANRNATDDDEDIRTVDCPYCETEMPRDSFASHLQTCPVLASVSSSANCFGCLIGLFLVFVFRV